MNAARAAMIRTAILDARQQVREEVSLGVRLDPPEGFPRSYTEAWHRTYSTEVLKQGEMMLSALAALNWNRDALPILQAIRQDPECLGFSCCKGGGCKCA